MPSPDFPGALPGLAGQQLPPLCHPVSVWALPELFQEGFGLLDLGEQLEERSLSQFPTFLPITPAGAAFPRKDKLLVLSLPTVTKRLVPCATPKAAWQHHILKAEEAAVPTSGIRKAPSEHPGHQPVPCATPNASFAAFPMPPTPRTPFPNTALLLGSLPGQGITESTF